MSERTGSQPPPLEPILIPDSPPNQENPTLAEPESKRRPELVAMVQKPPKAKKPRRTKVAAPLFTLEEVYEYGQSSGRDTSDLEKALRAMAYLLEWSSDIGNESPNSCLVHGIALTLNDDCVKQVRQLYTWDDVFKLGGDPTRLREKTGDES
jgi:hypothetical protein